MIYQDPFSCFDERLSIVEQVAEPLMVHKGMTQAEAQTVALRFLKAAGLPEHHAVKRPGVMSGGHRGAGDGGRLRSEDRHHQQPAGAAVRLRL